MHFVRCTLPPLSVTVGAVLSLSENVAASCEPPPSQGLGGDRWAAHYYRARACPCGSARAAVEEQSAELPRDDPAVAGVDRDREVQQIEALKGRLAWLQKQLFGRKSEASAAQGLAGAAPASGQSSATGRLAEAAAPGAERAVWRPRLRLDEPEVSSAEPKVPSGGGAGICPNKSSSTGSVRRSGPARCAARCGRRWG